MNLQDIRERCFQFRGESTTDGKARFSHAVVNSIINQKEKEILSEYPSLRQNKEVLIPIETTTLSSAYTAGGATFAVTSAANMAKGRYVVVTDGSNFELVQISSISTLTITPTAVLSNSYASGSYVSVFNHFLPYYCSRVLDCREWTTPAMLEVERVAPFHRSYPKPNSTGAPTTLVEFGMCLDREPAVGSVYTMDATTSTTSVVDTELTAGSDDYYNGWQLVNITRETSARIRDYVASTKTLTLESAITGQIATDTYFLIPRVRQFFLNPIPIADITLRVTVFDEGGNMINDYDEPIVAPAYHMILVYAALLDQAAGDSGSPLVRVHLGDWAFHYNKLLKAMKDDLPDADDMPEMATGTPGTLLN